MKSIDEQNRVFENLFVLEIANNHLGSVERGIKIISPINRALL